MRETVNRLDIVIPTAGRLPDLLRLLDSLHRHCTDSMVRWGATIAVTDDRYGDEAHAALAKAFPAVRHVCGPARGPAANRNYGASLGCAEWILFLDDDCYVQSDLLAAYQRRLAEMPESKIVEGAIRALDQRPNGNHHAPLNLFGGYLWSCNLLLRRDVFESVGRFDERFPFACMEDVDLRRRLQAVERVVPFAGEAMVVHPWRSISEREVSRQIISHAIYAQKHPEFVAGCTLRQLMRLMRGRIQQYRSGRFSSIPWRKYRTVGYDLIAPLLVYVMLHLPTLRRRVADRYLNTT